MTGLHPGKVAIVTGAGRGIGRACAERLHAEGASVVACDLVAPEWASGPGLAATAVDVRDTSALAKLVEETEARFGVPQILVNNAGILVARDFLEQTEHEFDETIQVNLKSAFLLTQMVARRMIEGGIAGAIVNVSSINASLALPTHAAYAASKAGMGALTSVAAVALAPRQIRVNAVAPGTIGTDMVHAFFEQTPDALAPMKARTPLGRMGTMAEVAAAVSFLASDNASYITGHTMAVDGGRSVLNMTMTRQAQDEDAGRWT